MKNIILTGSFLILPFFLYSQTRPDPPRLKRADSFFGVHFDFHAGPDCNEIGKNVDKAMIEWDMEGPSSIAATITPYGKGQIAAVYMNIGNAYLYRSTPVVREFLDDLVQEMQPGLMIEVKGSHLVDVTLNRLRNATILNLVNAAGPHDNDKVLVFDEIPALGPLQISIRYPEKPKRVMLQPENRALNFTYEKGLVRCSLPSLEIHEMVIIE